MTEAEWLACDNPSTMLEFLREKASCRKLRLMMCASVRRIWPLLRDVRSRQGVETSERFADRQVKRIDLHRAQRNAEAAAHARLSTHGYQDREYRAANAADYATMKDAGFSWAVSHACYEALGAIRVHEWECSVAKAEQRGQAALIRDLFGNPFQTVPAALPRLSANDPTISLLTQAAYEERILPRGEQDNTRLAVLADALEEAGCTNATVLDHLRAPGMHVRGCWPIDLLLNKE